MTDDEAEIVRRLDGMYIGLLSVEELQAVNRCIAAGIACKDYSGVSGLLGLGKARWIGYSHDPD